MKLIFIVLLLSSCSNKHENTNKRFVLVNSLYEEGNTFRTKQDYKIVEGDTIFDGVYKLYYPSGQIKLQIDYSNGYKEGLEKGFYNDGNLHHIGFYKDDKQDSLWIWFYNNGNIQAKDYWVKGKPFGSQYKYYSDGNLSEYFLYTLEGMIYKREYDKKGMLQKELGMPVFVYFNKDSLSKTEPFEFMTYVATPSDCKVSFKSYLSNSFGFKKEIITVGKLIGNTVSYSNDQKFERVGRYQWEGIFTLKDTVRKVDRIDTITISLNVF